MKRLFLKIFPPYEVRLTIESAKAFLARNAGTCLNVVEPMVIDLIKDTDRTVYSVRIDGIKPDHLALMLIANVVASAIGSGSFHIYRGVLSTVGRDMLVLWHRTQTALLESGYATKAEIDEDNAWIQGQVEGAG